VPPRSDLLRLEVVVSNFNLDYLEFRRE